MRDFSKYKEISKTSSLTVYVVETDPDILITVPVEGLKETPQNAHDNVEFLYDYERTTGKPCSAIVIMDNLLSQEAESRRAYQEIDPRRVYAAALIVGSPLARALGSFFIGLSRPVAPTKLFDSVEKAVEWLKTMRPE